MAAIKKQKIEEKGKGAVETKPEAKAVEAKSEMVKEEKKVATEVKTEYKRTDYEYKSWSGGVSVPEGWERCPGYVDVIRRLKVAPPKIEGTPAKSEAKDTAKAKDDSRESWNSPQGGCCH